MTNQQYRNTAIATMVATPFLMLAAWFITTEFTKDREEIEEENEPSELNKTIIFYAD